MSRRKKSTITRKVNILNFSQLDMVTLWTLSSSADRREYFVCFTENSEAPDNSFPTSTNSSNLFPSRSDVILINSLSDCKRLTEDLRSAFFGQEMLTGHVSSLQNTAPKCCQTTCFQLRQNFDNRISFNLSCFSSTMGLQQSVVKLPSTHDSWNSNC